MINRPSVFVFLALLASAGAAHAGSTVSRQEFFSISIPEGFELHKNPPGPDFETFSVTDGKVSYVIIYVGNAPDFPKLEGGLPNEELETVLTPNLLLRSIWSNRDNIGLEMLIQRQTMQRAPIFVHAWTPKEVGENPMARRSLLSLVVGDVKPDSQ